jgi:hypothetical protein
VSELFRRADSILEAACVPGDSSGGTAIVMDREGGIRIMNSEGWTLNGIINELGAAEVYMIQYCAETITVEAWSTTDHCTVAKTPARPPVFRFLRASERRPEAMPRCCMLLRGCSAG